MNNVFVLYDRNTGSVWYPLHEGAFDAVAGEDRGKQIEFTAKPPKMPLAEWAREHPDTEVLLPTERDLEQRRRQRERRQP